MEYANNCLPYPLMSSGLIEFQQFVITATKIKKGKVYCVELDEIGLLMCEHFSQVKLSVKLPNAICPLYMLDLISCKNYDHTSLAL